MSLSLLKNSCGIKDLYLVHRVYYLKEHIFRAECEIDVNELRKIAG